MPTHPPADPSSAPGSGTMTNLARLKRDGSYSLAELQEFIAQMRGRSPQEVLGMVSASELVRSIGLATLGCIVLMAVLTVGPYMLGKRAPATVTPEATASANTTPPAASPASTDEVPPTATAATDTIPSAADPSAAAKALNIDEVKTAPADVNPLDTDLDKLLDGKD